MTQKDKDLLLKDLCTRLPYGVKVQVAPVPSKEYEHITFNAKIVYIDINYIGVLSDWNFVFQQDITEVKPYLFPLSSMTEEQKRESPFESSLLNAFINGYISLFEDEELTIDDLNGLYDWFNKNHFDYRGLIPMGLANDATGLNIYSD